MKKLHLKKLNQQVIVITGATSGIGLATARMAAAKGAKLVLAARNEEALRELVREIRTAGGTAIHVEADVGLEEYVRRIAAETFRHFGGFDTWVNNAGVSVYGRALDVSSEDMIRVMETNFWGVVYGSRIACEYLRNQGGALINVGSEVSDKAVPLQGIYSASKHAVKGWTDALRMELEQEGAPVSVTLIKPAAIDTPYTEHAKNYLRDQPKHTAPVYAPEIVAQAILHAATTPVRDLFVGGGSKAVSALANWVPRVADKVVGAAVNAGTHSGKPAEYHDALYEAGEGMRERGNYPGHVMRTSLYTKASMHPLLTGMVVAGAGVAVAAILRGNGTSVALDKRKASLVSKVA